LIKEAGRADPRGAGCLVRDQPPTACLAVFALEQSIYLNETRASGRSALNDFLKEHTIALTDCLIAREDVRAS